MKKIALTIAAVASLGLTACGGNDAATDANTPAVDLNATDEAVTDVNAATDAAVDNALDNAAAAAGEASEAADNAAENVAEASDAAAH